MNQNKKHLATIHTIGTIDEYYTIQKDNKSDSYFLLVQNTRSGVREFRLSPEQLPKNIKMAVKS